MLLYEFIEVLVEQFERQALSRTIGYHMASEHKIVFDFDNMTGMVGVFFDNKFQQFGFDLGLNSVLWLVFNDLQGDLLFELMVVSLEDLAEGSFADDGEHFIPVGNLVVRIDLEVAFLIIEGIAVAQSHGPSLSQEIDHLVVFNLLPLHRSELLSVAVQAGICREGFGEFVDLELGAGTGVLLPPGGVLDAVDGPEVVAAVDVSLLGGLLWVYGRLTTLGALLLFRCRLGRCRPCCSCAARPPRCRT